ncbi:MAG TPA: TetR family transcriptional regulator [Chitinophagaceae bacterium]|nr:TetR family transcriptional regulator [Chitinophagaceae bacterium]
MAEHLNKDENVLTEILSAARALFEKQGLKKTTMDDIASRIGKCKGALYYYFASKDEIFEAVVHQEMTEFFKQVSLEINAVYGAKEKLIAYCRTRLKKISELCNLHVVVKKDLIDFAGKMELIKKRYDTLQVALVKDIIQEGIKKAEFRPMDNEYIESLSYLIVSSFRGLEMPLNVDRPYSSLHKRAEFIVNVMVDGIGCQQAVLPAMASFN